MSKRNSAEWIRIFIRQQITLLINSSVKVQNTECWTYQQNILWHSGCVISGRQSSLIMPLHNLSQLSNETFCNINNFSFVILQADMFFEKGNDVKLWGCHHHEYFPNQIVITSVFLVSEHFTCSHEQRVREAEKNMCIPLFYLSISGMHDLINTYCISPFPS